MQHHALLSRSVLFLLFCLSVIAQDCSKTVLCATGCCSQYGFCGTDDAHCGAGCLSTCDFKLGCDANTPCASGCCSKFGFCGLGPDYCSADNCVNNCDSKSYCDPGGFGAAYVDVETCPLNVCCSKFGYCGTTEEFCGNHTVTRPSCDAGSGSLQRVVGYYESWATTRSCQAFMPENIPIGVYSHLNFAFAGIDPVTFAVVPGADGDTELYTRLTNLKQKDPNLKVFIAIGGWTFNDPGPTATTFSDIAASEDNQIKFITSLISFLSTYNFDGVDIDWEYPAADDRSGRPEDFVNFVSFIANLRSALDATGRNGLSITTPVSFWYLQHFDIAKLIDYVDFFNVMSYDLHGTWDKGNRWLGNFLNGHTNMTEITEYLDLFWRNRIDPAKLNLGLAFYSRTFKVSDTSCTEPGCLWDSGGDPGPCTKDLQGGTLSLAEIDDLLATSTTPVLDPDAMIKMTVSDGTRWIGYDDGDTWKLKIQAALGQCFGGVMVWAVSQDIPDTAKYSWELYDATGWQSPDITIVSRATGDFGIDPTIARSQCTWSDCGQQCPSVDGLRWTTIPRSDNDGGGSHDAQLMNDATNCPSGMGTRLLCCPPDLPTGFNCGWWNLNGGWCDGTCPTGYVEVGSYSGSCKNGVNTGRYQAACCTVMDPITHVFGDYYWQGTQDDCGYIGCPTGDPQLFSAYSGSGAVSCYYEAVDGTVDRIDRNYCRESTVSTAEWGDCGWFQTSGSINTDYSQEYCAGGCPNGMSRVALRDENCQVGAEAYCCVSRYRTAADEDELAAVYAEELDAFYKNPTCPANPFLRTRNDDDASYDLAAAPNVTQLVRRQTSPTDHFKFTMDVSLHILTYTGVSWWYSVWDNHIAWSGGNWPYLRSSTLQAFFKAVQSAVPGLNAQDVSYSVACNPDDWDRFLHTWDIHFEVTGCDASTLVQDDPDTYLNDEEDGDYSPEETFFDGVQKRQEKAIHYGDGTTIFVRRGIGGVRHYYFEYKGKEYGPFTSVKYPNGDNGNFLEDITGDSSRYGIDFDDDDDDDDEEGCIKIKFVDNLDPAERKWVTEHIVEIQSIPRYLRFALSGTMDGSASTGLGSYTSGYQPITDAVINFLSEGNPEWNAKYGSTPMSDIMNNMGSSTNPSVLVNCEAGINGMKAKLWKLQAPVSRTALTNAGADKFTEEGYKAFIAKYKAVLGVWKYLDKNSIQSKATRVYLGVADVLSSVQEYLSKNKLGDFQLWEMWQEYLIFHTGRMATFTKYHVKTVCDAFILSWQTWLMAKGSSATPDDMDNTQQAVQLATALVQEFADIGLDETIFQQPPLTGTGQRLRLREEEVANASEQRDEVEKRHKPQHPARFDREKYGDVI